MWALISRPPTAPGRGADFPQALQGQSWQQFSVQSPAQAAMEERARTGQVTGSTYEQGGRITGPFDMAGGKVTAPSSSALTATMLLLCSPRSSPSPGLDG